MRPRSAPAASAAFAFLALLTVSLFAAGCGGDESTSPPASTPAPEASGTLNIAVASRIKGIDPLLSDDRAERLAARQIFEPLVSSQAGPFGQTRRLPGLVRRLDPHRNGTLWTARLRPGVAFADGELLDADAVKANAARWMSVGPGPEIVPGLDFVDSPRPGVVRFFLDRPDPRFGRTLALPRLGIIAPSAITAAGDGEIRPDASGTGPFQLRSRELHSTLLVRNAGWWGTPLGLGPGVDQVQFDVARGDEQRAADLGTGEVQVADDLGAATAHDVDLDPLLTTIRGRDGTVGVERSVRGVDVAAADQPLADVWLTDLR